MPELNGKKEYDKLRGMRRKFVDLIPFCESITAAYAAAGYKRNASNAFKVFNDPRIQAAHHWHIRNLAARQEKREDRIMDELWAVAGAKLDAKRINAKAKVDALTTLAKITGKLVERHQVDQTNHQQIMKILGAALEGDRAAEAAEGLDRIRKGEDPLQVLASITLGVDLSKEK